MKWNIKQILKSPRRFFALVYPYLLAHHPICKYYEEHFITIKGKKLCIGCTFLIPSFLFSVVIFLFTSIPTILFNSINLQNLFLIGLILATSQLLIHFLRVLKRSKKVKSLLKVISGVGFGLIVYVILKIPIQSEHPLITRLIYLFLIYYVFVFPYGFFKIRNITKTCTACKFRGDWDICDGFKDFNKKMYEENFWIRK